MPRRRVNIVKYSEYHVKMGTILYAVIRSGETRIFGVPNIFSEIRPQDLPKIESDAIDDLLGRGLATMDFNGIYRIYST